MASRVVCAIGSTAFYVAIFGIVAPAIVVFWPFIYLSPKAPFFVFRVLTKFAVQLMRIFLGIRIRAKGMDILQRLKDQGGGFIVAPKHQSEVETLIFPIFLDSFRIVYRDEIKKIPIISHYMKRMNFIAIERASGRTAMKTLTEEGPRSGDTPVIIFPEGTRSLFGERGHYHGGVAIMYGAMNVPILPVVHNAGEFFPAHAFVKYPGTITFEFLEPIMPGFPLKDALRELESRLEGDEI